MSDGASSIVNRATALREAFDRGFAEAYPPDPPVAEDLLAIRVGAAPYVLRLAEIAGLFADRKITPLPGNIPTLRGIAGFRGTILPVYDLHALLGHPPVETLRWLVTAKDGLVAFGFGALDGHLRLPRTDIVPRTVGQDQQQHIYEYARTDDAVCPVVHLGSVLDEIRKQLPARAVR
ncbi:MAG TPA: chemotaxis protein CheW [Stellaceae bacterium]|jgi:purine-binding chemotaxis protein CheW|nr:chemotaxis protein CheW [Stellaceae bacterium]